MCEACATWQLCGSNQACVVDPNSHWNVVAVSTALATTDPNGASWDLGGGAPDPYARCEIPIGAQVGVTDTVQDMFSAAWNQTVCPNVQASVLLGNTWSLCVFDEDVTTPDVAGCWPGPFTDSDFAASAAGQTIQQTLRIGTPPVATQNTMVLKLQVQ
jgi:hypothetical protein